MRNNRFKTIYNSRRTSRFCKSSYYVCWRKDLYSALQL